jgi:GNAT superfamily N-acetyltransferase
MLTLKNLIEEYRRTGRPTRAWLIVRNLKIYVRVTRRYVGEVIHDSLDVASVEVPERYRGRGIFTRWMDKAEEIAAANGMTIYVESILEPRLLGFLRKRSYTMLNESIPPVMFKLPSATAPSAHR